MDRPVIKRIKYVTLQDCQWLIIRLSKCQFIYKTGHLVYVQYRPNKIVLFTLCTVLCIILSHLFSTFEIKIIKNFIF